MISYVTAAVSLKCVYLQSRCRPITAACTMAKNAHCTFVRLVLTDSVRQADFLVKIKIKILQKCEIIIDKRDDACYIIFARMYLREKVVT